MMTRKEKRLMKFLKNPGSLRYEKIEKLLLRIGFEKVKIRGSHRKFRHPLLGIRLSIPVHNNDCKRIYKNITAKIIKRILYE